MGSILEDFGNPERSGGNIARMNPEQIADALYCLCGAAEEGKLSLAEPGNTVIREDGSVLVTPGEQANAYYAAPEVLLGRVGAPGKNAGWFTLGLLSYFVIYGRSFYEDRQLDLVSLPELVGQRKSLITADGVRPDAQDVPSLLRLAVEAFTAWEPGGRDAGVSFLLDAVRQFTATAEILYVCRGQTVYSETRTVTPPRGEIRRGTAVSASDGRAYTVRDTVSLAFRPGFHRFTVKVGAQAAGGAETPFPALDVFLCFRRGQDGPLTRLLRCEAAPQVKKIEFSRSAYCQFLFYIVTADPVSKKVVSCAYRDKVGVPAGENGERSLLQVSFDPASGFEVALYNRAGTQRISDNTVCFSV